MNYNLKLLYNYYKVHCKGNKIDKIINISYVELDALLYRASNPFKLYKRCNCCGIKIDERAMDYKEPRSKSISFMCLVIMFKKNVPFMKKTPRLIRLYWTINGTFCNTM